MDNPPASDIAASSTIIASLSECPCSFDGNFFCQHLQRNMVPHLAHLCRDVPGYRALWERRRDDKKEPNQKSSVSHPIRDNPHLRQWITERTSQLRTKGCYRTLEESLSILDQYCIKCEHFNKANEVCMLVKNCGGHRIIEYRHSLVSFVGKCPDGKWHG